jgi:hypothetical protein
MAKLVYEKEGVIYASAENIPTDNDDKICDRDVIEGHKLVYSKKVGDTMKVFISDSGIPAEGDKDVAAAQAAKEKAQKQAGCGDEENGHKTVDEEPADGICDECEKEIVEDGGEE